MTGQGTGGRRRSPSRSAWLFQPAQLPGQGAGLADEGAHVLGVVIGPPQNGPRIAGRGLAQRASTRSREVPQHKRLGRTGGTGPGRRDRQLLERSRRSPGTGWGGSRPIGERGGGHACDTGAAEDLLMPAPPPISSAVYGHTPTHGSVGDRQPAVVMAVDGTEPDEPERGADDGGPQTVVEDPVAGVIPMSGWLLRYGGFDPASEGLREALCALGNGRFVTRGSAPEARADDVHYPGTYAAGVFNRLVDEKVGAADREREHRQPARLAVADLPRRGRRLGGPGDVDRQPLRAGTRSAPRGADPPVPGRGRGGAAHRGGPAPGGVDGRPVPGLPGQPRSSRRTGRAC